MKSLEKDNKLTQSKTFLRSGKISDLEVFFIYSVLTFLLSKTKKKKQKNQNPNKTTTKKLLFNV